MTGTMPKFYTSKYFVKEPVWRLKDDAPDELKEEFEEYQNSGTGVEYEMRYKYPNMKKPKYCWDGVVRDMK